jgi:hypothetical protein
VYADLLYLGPPKILCGEIIYEILLELVGNIDSERQRPLCGRLDGHRLLPIRKIRTPDTVRTAAGAVEAGRAIGELNRALSEKKQRAAYS